MDSYSIQVTVVADELGLVLNELGFEEELPDSASSRSSHPDLSSSRGSDRTFARLKLSGCCFDDTSLVLFRDGDSRESARDCSDIITCSGDGLGGNSSVPGLRDICGIGDFSKVFTFTTAACPARVKMATVKLVSTNVEVTWDEPKTAANAPILGY